MFSLWCRHQYGLLPFLDNVLIISVWFPRSVLWMPLGQKSLQSSCNASHIEFCPIILLFISWRALENLNSSSGGTTLLFPCCLFNADGRPFCTRGNLFLLFFLLDFLATAAGTFSARLKLGCSDNTGINSCRVKRYSYHQGYDSISRCRIGFTLFLKQGLFLFSSGRYSLCFILDLFLMSNAKY